MFILFCSLPFFAGSCWCLFEQHSWPMQIRVRPQKSEYVWIMAFLLCFFLTYKCHTNSNPYINRLKKMVQILGIILFIRLPLCRRQVGVWHWYRWIGWSWWANYHRKTMNHDRLDNVKTHVVTPRVTRAGTLSLICTILIKFRFGSDLV